MPYSAKRKPRAVAAVAKPASTPVETPASVATVEAVRDVEPTINQPMTATSAPTVAAVQDAQTAPVQTGYQPLPSSYQPVGHGGLAALAAPGITLTTAHNTAEGRASAVARMCHLCKAGEHYVTDETMVETDHATGFLLWQGDVICARSDSGYRDFREYIGRMIPSRKAVDRELASTIRQISVKSGEVIPVEDGNPDDW